MIPPSSASCGFGSPRRAYILDSRAFPSAGASSDSATPFFALRAATFAANRLLAAALSSPDDGRAIFAACNSARSSAVSKSVSNGTYSTRGFRLTHSAFRLSMIFPMRSIVFSASVMSASVMLTRSPVPSATALRSPEAATPVTVLTLDSLTPRPL